MSEVELDFLGKLLINDPEARMTGLQCLQHPYLRGERALMLLSLVCLLLHACFVSTCTAA